MPREKMPHEWDKNSFHIYFHKDHAEYLRQRAHEKRVSVSAVVREIVDQHCSKAAR